MGAQYCGSLKGVVMKILRFSCTGPCGVQPGCHKNCSEVHLLHFGVGAIPEPGTPLPSPLRERLLAIMHKHMCPNIDISTCQVWVGTDRDVACVERVFDALVASDMTHDITTQWIQSVLMDPEHVPDVVSEALKATKSAEVLEAFDRLVEHCIELRRRPVGELHSLSDPVPA